MTNMHSLIRHHQVTDNGKGMSRDDMLLIGERYATSKQYSSHSFGFKGEALASIVQISNSVELMSRHHLSQLTYCKQFQGGRNNGLVSPTVHLNHAGTTVIISGLFYNLPVRRKHSSPSLEIEKLKNALCQDLLVFSHISFSLNDSYTGNNLIHVSVTSSLLTRYNQLYSSTKRVVGIQHTAIEYKGMKINALLPVMMVSGSILQLLFINRQYILNQSLHLLISKLLKPVDRDGHRQRIFYVIVIDGDNIETGINSYLHIQQEKKLVNALTSLIQSFLVSNHFSITKQQPSSCITYKSPPSYSSGYKPINILPMKRHKSTSLNQSWNTVINTSTKHLISGVQLEHDQHSLSSSDNIRCSSVRISSNNVMSSILSDWKNPTFTTGDEV